MKKMCIRDSYKGEELIDTYTTDENGQFTTEIVNNTWHINRKDFEVKQR